jgi:hypothetical protein
MSRKHLIQLVASFGGVLVLYVLSYAPVMAFLFWGFNTGHVSDAALYKGDAFYAPVVRFGPSSDFFDPYGAIWSKIALGFFDRW